ncbi:MAG: DUF4350 domain-containing protein [Pyrinomonadaceae bacterium]|nr:DUF4350 domain-containing protein [Pyrinomonadaceae bacterium]
MKEKFLIFGALFVLIIVLIGLNTASYVQQEKKPDNEMTPNRSTFNVGATGTRALHDLLLETGRKVERWQDPPSVLLNYEIDSPSTFVIIGEPQVALNDSEIDELLIWVEGGGRLVLIDRRLPEQFLTSTNGWKISLKDGEFPGFDIDPSNQTAMTAETIAAKPFQPTVATARVNAVQPSRFASGIKIEKEKLVENSLTDSTVQVPVKTSPADDIPFFEENSEDPPPPVPEKFESEPGGDQNSAPVIPPPPTVSSVVENSEPQSTLPAPIVSLSNGEKNILTEFAFGDGSIVILSDPFIVSNGGISLVDNGQLAIDLLDSRGGIIAFDEYHQGYGKNNNRLLAYFDGTPVIAFFLQIAALAAFIFYSRSRRFARALPGDEPDRLSKLEYVAAMAELQQRTKAFDLAIENIYRDFRRRVSRLVGVDNFTVTRQELARKVAERVEHSTEELDIIFSKCEDIMHGEKTNKSEVIDLIGKLREIEDQLGLRRGKV